ncbi:helix-turn-helix transcriptional regulator [Nonomuraea sp. NPDC046802]|uniref:helix-turn-helix domain-containing protein n=1 Tax=Nonomuraea sp. NPDC046802 TaxID=3154919 RepID=UPI0033FAEC33
MAGLGEWSGLEAKLLRKALRLTLREFAAQLKVAEGTVSKWEKRGADIHPLPRSQQLLDMMLARADAEAHQRFTGLLSQHGAAVPLGLDGSGDSRPG